MQLKSKCKVVHHRAQFLGVCKYQIQLELKYRVNKLRYVYCYVQMFPMISSTPPYHFLPRGHRPLPMATAIVARGRWWYCSQHASWRERLWNGNKPGRMQGWYVYCYVQMFPIISSTPPAGKLVVGPRQQGPPPPRRYQWLHYNIKFYTNIRSTFIMK